MNFAVQENDELPYTVVVGEIPPRHGYPRWIGAYCFTMAGTEHVNLQIHVYEVWKHEPFKNVYLYLQLELGTQVHSY